MYTLERKIKTLSANLADGGKVPEGYDPTSRQWYKASESDTKSIIWGNHNMKLRQVS